MTVCVNWGWHRNKQQTGEGKLIGRRQTPIKIFPRLSASSFFKGIHYAPWRVATNEKAGGVFMVRDAAERSCAWTGIDGTLLCSVPDHKPKSLAMIGAADVGKALTPLFRLTHNSFRRIL